MAPKPQARVQGFGLNDTNMLQLVSEAILVPSPNLYRLVQENRANSLI
jgi:hypothetical protein